MESVAACWPDAGPRRASQGCVARCPSPVSRMVLPEPWWCLKLPGLDSGNWEREKISTDPHHLSAPPLRTKDQGLKTESLA